MRCYAEGVRTVLNFDKASPRKGYKHEITEYYFSGKDRSLFHFVNTTGNIFTRENITDGVHSMK